jgi:DNA mismatch repair ATPase MutS
MEVLKTRDAKSVYSKISSVVKSYVVTKQAKERFSLDVTCDKKKIRDAHEKIKKYYSVDDSTLDSVRGILKDFRLTEGKSFFVDRIIATEDEEIYEKLLPLKKHCDVVHLIERDNQNLEEQGKHVILVEYEPKTVDVLPEYVLCDFVVNRDALRKIFELYSLLSKFREFDDFRVKSELTEEIINEIFMFNDKIEFENAELTERRKNLNNFKNFVSGELKEINSAILSRVDKQEIKIGGKELLEMNVKNISELSVFKEVIRAVIEEHVKKISEKFGVNASRLNGIFENSYPSKVNEQEVKFLANKLNEEILEKEYNFKVKLARKLSGKENFLRDASEKIIELDLILAVIKFRRENNCSIPKISESGSAIYFKRAKNLFIEEGAEPVVPVTYSLGGEIERKKVAILTGANSGGKTTLLKTILQIQILAQSGFPVSAEYFEFPVIDEIYFLSKHSGTLNAGAFERTLKDISKILVSNKKKLVLIDELESITEPGAAARMVSSILEMLVESGDFAVVVTHLSEEILKHISKDIRVDGITATGLDENLNLIVDRQPKFNAIGKSTPELIVEKLYRKSEAGDEERKVYERILARMKER